MGREASRKAWFIESYYNLSEKQYIVMISLNKVPKGQWQELTAELAF